ncbi:MAG: glycosyl hydrolase family 18 protein [Vulcanimicrobiota bacterium]
MNNRWVRRLLLLFAFAVVGYAAWNPGRHEPLPARHNGAWLTHAWWADQTWFDQSARRQEDYLDQVERLQSLLEAGIDDWYVHACPCYPSGELPAVNLEQARRLTAVNHQGQVLAWVGGMVGEDAFPERPQWRRTFAQACARLVKEGELDGISLNLEPCPSFTPGFLELLEELRVALPVGARLSVVAHPPPSWLHPVPALHWNRGFYAEVSARCDDLCVMAYDTAQPSSKTYTHLVSSYSRRAMQWSSAPVRVGLPAYEEDSLYHRDRVENLANALPGLAAALHPKVPGNYAGWAVYAEWSLDSAELRFLRQPTVPGR